MDENLKYRFSQEGGRINLRLKVFLQSFIFILTLIAAITSQTVFSDIQMIAEGSLIIILSGLFVIQEKDLTSWFLAFVFLVSQSVSFLLNDLVAFALNAKEFGLACLVVLVFRKWKISSAFVVHITFFVCVILSLIQIFDADARFPLEIGEYFTTSSWLIQGRPLGLFFSTHISAYFMAIYLIGFSLSRRLFLVDYFLLWHMRVATSLGAYLGQRVYTRIERFFPFFRSRLLAVALIIFALFVTKIFLEDILFILKTISPTMYTSGQVIFAHLFDSESYMNVAHLLFPEDVVAYVKKGLFTEVGYIRLVIQGGLILSLSYLFILISELPRFRFFLLVSLIHYAYVLLPLMLYTMFLFEDRRR